MKVRPVTVELFHAYDGQKDRETYRHDEDNHHFVILRTRLINIIMSYGQYSEKDFVSFRATIFIMT